MYCEKLAKSSSVEKFSFGQKQTCYGSVSLSQKTRLKKYWRSKLKLLVAIWWWETQLNAACWNINLAVRLDCHNFQNDKSAHLQEQFGMTKFPKLKKIAILELPQKIPLHLRHFSYMIKSILIIPKLDKETKIEITASYTNITNVHQWANK